MPRQFLLNPDGSVPAGTRLEVLEAEGIPLVLPTEEPRQYGMVAVELDPEKGPDGAWRQVWALEPAPPPEPEPEPVQEDGLAADAPPA